jgi:hypothetical protein
LENEIEELKLKVKWHYKMQEYLHQMV